MEWNDFIDEHELAALLPGPYRKYALPVKEGLAIFLSGLPEKRQQQIIAHQAELGMLASLPERLGRLAHDCPVLHKLGQTLARDQRLAPELREQLRPLESLPPSASISGIVERLRHELGPLAKLGITVGRQALAEASVAIVVPFVDASHRVPRQGVFKILKPGIEERLHEELALLSQVGAHLDECCHRLHLPELDYQAAFEQVRDKLSWEVRLDLEQEHLVAAKRCYADDPRTLIPTLLEYSTPRITAMERIMGANIGRLPPRSVSSNRGVAKRIAKAIVAHPVLSVDERSLFHGDPHAGNLLVTIDGRLAILDWSLVGWLDAANRDALVHLLLAAISLDAIKLGALLKQLAIASTINVRKLDHIIHERLFRLRRGELPGMNWMLGLLDDAVQQAGLRVSADLMLFRKTLLTLEGLIDELSEGDVRIDDVLLVSFVERFCSEWPQRFCQGLSECSPGTRISNADLVRLLLSAPTAAARWVLAELASPSAFQSTNGLKLGAPAAAGVP
jgi:ubiquinone biosynthesis protein